MKYRTYKYCCALVHNDECHLIDKLYAKFVKHEVLNHFGSYSKIKTKNSVLIRMEGIDIETFKGIKGKLGFKHG